MRQDSVRIAPLALDEFTDEQKALVGEWHQQRLAKLRQYT
jgi:hypothetical protein